MSGFILEVVRLVLYGVEFISDVVVFGTTADKMKVNSLLGSFCFFKGKAVFCNAILTFSIIAWLVLIGVIVWHCLVYLNKPGLPYLLEAIIFAALTVVWFITACLTTAPAGGLSSAKGAIRFFSWINILLHAGSAVVAFLHARMDKDVDEVPAAGTQEA